MRLLLVLLLLLTGCVTERTEVETDSAPLREFAQVGDFVEGEYSLSDGISVRQNFSALLGSGELLPGIERTILGMAPGDIRRVELAPAEAFGVWNASLARWEPRWFSIPRVVNISLQEFRDAFGEPAENLSFESGWLRVHVLNVGRGYVTIEREPIYRRLNVTGGMVEVTVNSTHIAHFFTPVLNFTVLDASGRFVTYRDANATHVLVDRNHPLAGKRLSAEVRLHRLVKRHRLEEMRISWSRDLNDAIRDAVAEDKPMLLYFYSRQCGQCSALEAGFQDIRFRLLAGKLVFVRLDISEEAAVAARYGVAQAPAVVVLSSSGEKLARLEGDFSAAEMLQVLYELGIIP
ncbi:thioredoxin domain-containing protein [Candidatus Pyrohabitans sp.]